MSILLKAPFPWFGGKSRAADFIWERFGDIPNYVEPFAGSLATLLARPHPAGTETVNDLDCYLANFWRALAAAPDAVAEHADWPVNEADLMARHRWLMAQSGFRARLKTEADYYDAKIAGWWVWGLCSWIGSGWCVQRRSGNQPEAPALGRRREGNRTPLHMPIKPTAPCPRCLRRMGSRPWRKRDRKTRTNRRNTRSSIRFRRA